MMRLRCGQLAFELAEEFAVQIQSTPLSHFAAVRLRVAHEQWLERHGDVRGYEAQVEILKNRLGPSGHTVTIAIEFNGTVRGDGL